MPKITTIKISTETKERLSKIKEYHRETYDEVLNKIFSILNTCRKEPEEARKKLESIDHIRSKRNEFIKKK